jgi:hypothetical protein
MLDHLYRGGCIEAREPRITIHERAVNQLDPLTPPRRRRWRAALRAP